MAITCSCGANLLLPKAVRIEKDKFVYTQNHADETVTPKVLVEDLQINANNKTKIRYRCGCCNADVKQILINAGITGLT